MLAYKLVCILGRAHLASLLKEHCLVEGGDSNVKQWLKDEGLDASVAHALKARFKAECLDCTVKLLHLSSIFRRSRKLFLQRASGYRLCQQNICWSPRPQKGLLIHAMHH